MISCPTCKRKAEPKARYCPACYTVFPSESTTRRRRPKGGKGDGVAWKFPTLFFVAIAIVWFLHIDLNDWSPAPGSYQAAAREAKRSLITWIDQPKSTGQRSTRRPPPDRAAWPFDNGDRLGCEAGALCEVVIHFGSGASAAYVIDRPRSGKAQIYAVDARGTTLLESATQGRLVLSAARGVAHSVSIARKDDRWSVVGEGPLLVEDSKAVPPGREEGV